MGANLVSTVRSFLPFVSKSGDAQPQPAAGKKPVKVSTSSRKIDHPNVACAKAAVSDARLCFGSCQT